MAHVITSACLGPCQAECVSVCPVDCIHGPVDAAALAARSPSERAAEGQQLFIDPDLCICCGLCAAECPPEAIYDEDDVPAEHEADIARNAAFFAPARPRDG